jgi:c-di-GMP-binding flagellar brake protein YcgR
MNARLLATIRTGGPSDASDRRTNERRICRVSGLLKADGYGPMRIRTVDLSTKGIALLLPRALPIRTTCELNFLLHLDGMLMPFAAKVEISNSVFLSSTVRAGCRFVSLDESTKKVLANFMRS